MICSVNLELSLLECLFSLLLSPGHLKETIIVQLIAFTFMTLLLLQFSGEFILKGLPHSIPLFGESYSQLAGVVLFNYAYIVTVPSWLIEKKNDVSVNTTIWSASTLSSVIYLSKPDLCCSFHLGMPSVERWALSSHGKLSERFIMFCS